MKLQILKRDLIENELGTQKGRVFNLYDKLQNTALTTNPKQFKGHFCTRFTKTKAEVTNILLSAGTSQL